MKREDLRSKIIPTTIENTDESQNTGNKEFNTIDLIYLDSYDEQYDGKKTDKERRISATDYAQMNNAYIYDGYRTSTGRQTTWAWLRSAYSTSMSTLSMATATGAIGVLLTAMLGCARLCIIIFHLTSPHEVRYDF